MKAVWIGCACAIAWMPLVGVIVQTARLPLSDGTRAAAAASRRRCAGFAVGWCAVVAALAAATDATWPLLVASLAAFHVGWWVGAAPLHRRGRAEADAPHDGRPTSRRVASLAPRDPERLLPATAWIVPTAAVALSAVLIVAAFVGGRLSAERSMLVAAMWCGGLSFLLAWGLWARAQSRAPQDLSLAPDAAEVDRAYAAYRRFMVRSVWAGATLASGLFAAIAAAAAWTGDDPASGPLLGWVGGVGGSLVGVAGAVFGAVADRRRRAILELGGVPPDVRLGGGPMRTRETSPAGGGRDAG